MKSKKFINKFMIIEFAVIFIVIAADIFLKMYCADKLQGQSVPLIGGIVNLTYQENSGAAFSMLQGEMLFFKITTVIAITVFGIFLYKKRGGNLLLRISSALIIGGALGNFIDRVKFGYVRDMIELRFMDFAIFNIADSSLTVGVILFAVYYLFIYKEPVKTIKICKQNSVQETPKTDE